MTEPQPGRHAASATLGAARARMAVPAGQPARFPRHRRPLSPELRQQIGAQFQAGEYCTTCGGIHAGLGMLACPRIAAAELDADGKLRYVVFWQPGEYDTSEVYFASDAEPDGDPA